MDVIVDHFKNARVIDAKKLGVYVNKMSVTLNTFTDAVSRIVTDERYAASSSKPFGKFA